MTRNRNQFELFCDAYDNLIPLNLFYIILMNFLFRMTTVYLKLCKHYICLYNHYLEMVNFLLHYCVNMVTRKILITFVAHITFLFDKMAWAIDS